MQEHLTSVPSATKVWKVNLGGAGYLCSTEKEYSDAITEVAALEDSLRTCLAAAARASSARFSDHAFKAAFLDALRPALPRSF